MTVYPLLYSLPMFTLSLFFIAVPEIDSVFFPCFFGIIPINAISFFLYMKAIKASPLSLSLPYLAFTPVFMIATGYLFLDEMPDTWGMAGIVIVCAGSYVLNIDPEKRGLFDPLKAVFREKGSWLMLIVSCIFSVTAAVGKKAIVASSPEFFSMYFFAVHNLFFSVCLLATGKVRREVLVMFPGKGLVAAILFFLHVLFHGFAISMTKAAYMISVKRFSVLFGVLCGGVFFKEKNLAIRLSGTGFMLAGAALITLKGN